MALELRLRDRVLRLDRTLVMGVLNVTPDSFSDGALHDEPERAVARALEMVAQGADLIDVGGESTRPGAAPVPVEEERRRVVPVVAALVAELERRASTVPISSVPISIDTRKPEIAAEALAAGAALVNDVSGLDEPMLDVAAEAGAAAIAMHMRGDPRTMQHDPRYEDVVAEVARYLGGRLVAARDRGVPVVLDPGIGFGKTVRHNLELLRNLDRITALGAPVLVGVSRKSFLGKIADADVDQRLAPTIACNTAAILGGAHIVRVHDVTEAVLAARAADAVRAARRLERGRIELRRLHCTARVGVTARERAAPQELTVDLTVTAPLGSAASSDSVEHTVDYVRLATITRDELERQPAALLEHLAARVGDRLLRELPTLGAVTVRLGKPLVAEQLDADAVTVELRSGR